MEQMIMHIVCAKKAVRLVAKSDSNIGDIANGTNATCPICICTIFDTITGNTVTESITSVKQLLFLATSEA